MAAMRDDFFVEGGRHERVPVSLMAAMRVDFSSRGEGINGPPGVFARPVGPRWSFQVALAVALVARPSEVLPNAGNSYSKSLRNLPRPCGLVFLKIIFRE